MSLYSAFPLIPLPSKLDMDRLEKYRQDNEMDDELFMSANDEEGDVTPSPMIRRKCYNIVAVHGKTNISDQTTAMLIEFDEVPPLALMASGSDSPSLRERNVPIRAHIVFSKGPSNDMV